MKRLALIVVMLALLAGCGGEERAVDGSVVTVFGPWRDAEAELFMRGVDDWAGENGIDVRYVGTGDLAQDLADRVSQAAAPDIALIPQPGLVAELYRRGAVLPLGTTARAAVAANYTPDARRLGVVDGVQVGVPFRVSVKSMVWYRPELFRELGVRPPRDLDELEELVAAIRVRGVTPWCIGIESQSATGWVATDWVEDIVARDADADLYRAWTAGEVGFRDPRIAGAFERVRRLAFAPGLAVGGPPGIIRTGVRDALGGLLDDRPDCAMHRQGSLVLSWLPSGTAIGPDGEIDAFVMPGRRAGETPPLVLGVDLAVGFSDRPEVQAVLAHLARPEAGRPWAAAGGYLSPRRSEVGNAHPPEDRRVLNLLLGADRIVVDASDAMPPEVGSGLLWREITDWVADPGGYPAMAARLDAARDPARR